jgi:hypothetical protein
MVNTNGLSQRPFLISSIVPWVHSTKKIIVFKHDGHLSCFREKLMFKPIIKLPVFENFLKSYYFL